MPTNSADNPIPRVEALRDACRTVCGLPPLSNDLVTRLQFVADLLANAGPLPLCPMLLWRQRAQPVGHSIIGSELVVGRKPAPTGLAFEDDKHLSRRHFVVRPEGDRYVLEDLRSRNGTAINRTDKRVRYHILCDGDVIFAGQVVFVYLDQGRRS